MTPRIAPVAEPNAEAAEALARTPSHEGRPLNVFATLAHHPLLLARTNALGGVFGRFSRIPLRERELVILRTAWASRSEYEFGHHSLIAGACALDSKLALVVQPDTSAWNQDDRALLSLVDELLRDCRVADDTWRALAGMWSEAQLLELLMMVGFYRMLAGYLNSAAVEREGAVPGWPR